MINSSTWNCLVIDAGARYGLHPTWRDARKICEFHLFEPESGEAKRLQSRYQGDPNISVHAIALAKKNKAREFVVREHLGLSNLETYDFDVSNIHPQLASIAREIKRVSVDAVSIDDFFRSARVDFLKLDTEGSDLEILEGAQEKLRQTVLGIRANVGFLKLSKQHPTFSDIDHWLKKFDFELKNIEIESRVSRQQGLFPLRTGSGTLHGADAIWTISPDKIHSKESSEIKIIYALFLYLNNLEDIGLQFLIDNSKRDGSLLADTMNNAYTSLLESRILFHLANALDLGWWETESITTTYSKLFDKAFPSKEELFLRLLP